MANSLYQKHIISIAELSRAELELIVKTAGQLKAQPNPELIKHKVVASCFFEPSTRTRLSFETAIQRIGGSVIGFDNGGNTSLAKKGETLADSVRVISSYVDAFVMRHPQEGAARLASEFSNGVPVINAVMVQTNTHRKPCSISTPFSKPKAVSITSMSRSSVI